MKFLKNPFQVKYIPVLICMALGIAAFAITQAPKALLILGALAVMQYFAAEKPLDGFYLYGYIALATIIIASGVVLLCHRNFAPAATDFAVGSLPVSIVLTRRGKANLT